MFGDFYPEDCVSNCIAMLIDVLVLQFEFDTSDHDKLYVPFRRMVGLLGQFGYAQYDSREVVRMTAMLVYDCDTRVKYGGPSGFRLLRALCMLRHIELVHRYGRSVFPPAFKDEEEERRRCILVLQELAPHSFWDGVSGCNLLLVDLHACCSNWIVCVCSSSSRRRAGDPLAGNPERGSTPVHLPNLLEEAPHA